MTKRGEGERKNGLECRRCGSVVRYVSNRKCVACSMAAKRPPRKTGDIRLGLESGFLKFGTLAHTLLLHTRDHGPMTHAEFVEDFPGVEAVRAVLTRLKQNGFLFRVDHRSSFPGRRGGSVMGLEPPTKPVKMKSARVRQKEYKQRMRARVPSVFEFRGSIQL